MTRRKISPLSFAISAALLVVMGGPSRAQAPDVASIRVDLTGLQLDTPAGRAIAERRIARAADRIAGRQDLRDLQAMAEFEQARETMIRHADVQLDRLVARAQAEHDEKLALERPGLCPGPAQGAALRIRS